MNVIEEIRNECIYTSPIIISNALINKSYNSYLTLYEDHNSYNGVNK